MEFSEKYIDVGTFDMLKAEDQEKEKRKIISNDTFALGDVISDLIKKIEHVRCSLK
jgi:hypothetical protein